MYECLLALLSRRPALFEQCTAAFWNDPHVSKGMLDAHLDPHLQGATREHAFVDRSVQWIQKALPPEHFKALVDLGCGPGLYAQRFDTAGYDVTAIDISERSIAYAIEQANRQKQNIRYRLQDYLTFCDHQMYDIATLIYCDYGVLHQHSRQRLLQNVYAALKPEGAFLLDVFTPREYRNKPENTRIQYCSQGFWSDQPYAIVQSFFRYDDANTFCDRYIVITASQMQCYHLWNHAFTPDELADELTKAGFSGIQFFGDVAGTPFQKNGRTLSVIARKHG